MPQLDSDETPSPVNLALDGSDSSGEPEPKKLKKQEAASTKEKKKKRKKKKRERESSLPLLDDHKVLRYTKKMVELYVVEGDFEKDPAQALALAYSEAKRVSKKLNRIRKRAQTVIRDLDTNDPGFCEHVLALEEAIQSTEESESGVEGLN